MSISVDFMWISHYYRLHLMRQSKYLLADKCLYSTLIYGCDISTCTCWQIRRLRLSVLTDWCGQVDPTDVRSNRQTDGHIEAVDVVTLQTQLRRLFAGWKTLLATHWNGLPRAPSIYTYFHFDTVCRVQCKWNF